MMTISFFDLKKTNNKITDNKKMKIGTYTNICKEFKRLILSIILNK